MMPDSSLATAADYADAMITARRAKRLIVLLLLLPLLVQLAMFFLIRYGVVIVAGDASTTQPADTSLINKLHYFFSLSMFAGLALSLVLSLVLLLIVNIMLVGRLIGIKSVINAYFWSLVAIVLLFPWQAFLGNLGQEATFRLGGVLCTWSELVNASQGATFASEPLNFAILKWARFVGFPLLAVIILLVIEIKSNRGMRQALGEEQASAS